jgi:hypothetical protein
MRVEMKNNVNMALGGLYQFNNTMYLNGKESTRRVKEAIRTQNSIRL